MSKHTDVTGNYIDRYLDTSSTTKAPYNLLNGTAATSLYVVVEY